MCGTAYTVVLATKHVCDSIHCSLPDTIYTSLYPRSVPWGRVCGLQDGLGIVGWVWGITLLRSIQLECGGFWIQQISSFRSSTRLVRYNDFQNFYVLLYSLPAISLTQTLVGWSDVFSLINTDGSIPALKTLPGKVFPQTLYLAGWVWGPDYIYTVYCHSVSDIIVAQQW